ncbi:MAG: arginine--tRNA ligase [Gammaproteobacteria bacterium]|nr:arginine--tRNA ligase [Gammaproteobacteria bacterium]
MRTDVKEQIKKLIIESLKKIDDVHDLDEEKIEVNSSKNKDLGDFSTNIALKLSKQLDKNPIEIAKDILNNIKKDTCIKKIEIAKPGFINFFTSENIKFEIINTILSEKDEFGKNNIGNKEKVLVEFVSANPTGPLHVGHGRGAAYGDCISNLLSTSGYSVSKEYYVNDAGKQINILAVSVILRYHELIDKNLKFRFSGLYEGDYIWDISAYILNKYNNKFFKPQSIENNEEIDEYINVIMNSLGDKFQVIKKESVDYILKDIKKTLEGFNVNFDSWFSENKIISDQSLKKIIDVLLNKDCIEEKDGAIWFKSSNFFDEKDRVLVKANKDHTYFLSDIAYHSNKIERGYKQIINIWGADHHGYVDRMKASFNILSNKDTQLKILLVQFANLYRGKQKIPMSTREGNFITLKELFTEVGVDAARFFYLMRKTEQHLDFDIELAKSKNSENPVYYVQYAHARICSIFKQLEEKSINYTHNVDNLKLLNKEEEVDILNKLNKYPEIIETATRKFEPHLLINYIRELSQLFHAYYNKFKILNEEENIRNARLSLLLSIKQILNNSSKIIGIKMPNQM